MIWTSWKLWVVWFSIIAFIGLFASGFNKDPKEVPSALLGKFAPDFEFTTLNGSEVRLSNLRGKPVLLNFWASWCQECKLEANVIGSFSLKYASSEKRISVIGIAVQDTLKKAKDFVKHFGKKYLVGLDDNKGNIALDYGIYGVPETFFIDPNGIIFYKHIGVLTMELLEKKFKPYLY